MNDTQVEFDRRSPDFSFMNEGDQVYLYALECDSGERSQFRMSEFCTSKGYLKRISVPIGH